ncbi:MAG: MFS transporter, partial [Fulvivirga sp.]
MTTIGPLSIDMYLPAFEEISIGLNTDINHISLSLSSFFIGLAVGQLFYGPMLERFGRKKPVYVGLGLYVLASIGCAFSTSVEGLIAFRFFQALGS